MAHLLHFCLGAKMHGANLVERCFCLLCLAVLYDLYYFVYRSKAFLSLTSRPKVTAKLVLRIFGAQCEYVLLIIISQRNLEFSEIYFVDLFVLRRSKSNRRSDRRWVRL